MKNRDVYDKQWLEQDLQDIDKLLEDGSVDFAYKAFTELINKIESEGYEASEEVKANAYASFAYFLFRVSEYEGFFEMYVKAQDHGYPKDEIEKFLLEAFVEPNSNEFQKIYETNIQFLVSNSYIKEAIGFQSLSFWLLPTGNANEYYMYDREQKVIKDKIALFKYQVLKSIPTINPFSDFLLVESWDWRSILSYTNAVRKMNKKAYIVLDDIRRFLACLQGALLNDAILSNVLIFDSVSSMINYFKSCSAFLPRNMINNSNKSIEVQEGLNEVHKFRLLKGNRKGDNILLSICIPSYNRGNRAYDNITHLLQSSYDEEIEVILSNNGTENTTKEHYEKIGHIDDTRFHYFSFKENQGFAINLCKVCELARGKFILLLSDEDLIDFDSLDKIMSTINQAKETLALIRTSTSIQSRPPAFTTAKLGKDALLTFMLSSNYISGIIFNNDLLKKYRGIEFIKENITNSVCFWYPHMFWELLLCQYGNVLGTDLVLVIEGEAEKMEVGETVFNEIIIPTYATIEGRIEQHEDFFRIIEKLEICAEDLALFREMYIKLCLKTMFLAVLAINIYYKKVDSRPLELLDKVYEFCTRKEFFETSMNNNPANYQSDLVLISQYYEHFKKQI
ncbi:hypothetical protein PAECIP111891_04307 [Paenibacillus allorhizoplanae]|uniref:Glycosyltransferase 2-like domain-containing protein n=1 Tax=Paenibacillus allorhizoplanae TaxID=2905648 RepID=A0ABM9CM00_9BACL|nr:glycosyltransferase [Paenibacillus allorhizoplanae]CAH1215761.1 hypothetical protein PAECIP111891_04307 [Paenibacillus allorhizoplanae]